MSILSQLKAKTTRTALNPRANEADPFDLTPVIDVVFLLIIFFMLVCQFMAEEQFAVEVPDRIQTAQSRAYEKKPLTLTVLLNERRQPVYAIEGQELAHVEGQDLANLITSAINEGLTDRENTVRLRCDKRVTFGQVKYILSGISNSRAQQLDWAVLAE